MVKKKKQYTQEFKESAVKLITGQGYKVAEAARNLGVNANVSGRWKREVDGDGGREVNNRKELQAELPHPRKENQRLKLEREILKKAAAFFARESGYGIKMIDTEKKAYPAALLCDVMKVSRSGCIPLAESREIAKAARV